ncbi:MAG: double-strand break repair helicase AddA, partial [Alphaproteobacteria bacterium]|nr:double-strand break repair helicase AddA [Alphaproteobacteria bacterium]
ARRRLGVAAGESEQSVIAAACEEDSSEGGALRAAAAALAEGGAGERERGAVLQAWLGAAPVARAELFPAYLGVFFTKGGAGERRKTLASKAALARLAEADGVLAAEALRLAAVRDRLRALAVVISTAALLTLGQALMAAYGEEKRRHALLDYDDLILSARGLLLRPGVAPWVLYKLDGGLDHILIDEAQDTNPEQWEVVAALAEEFFSGLGAREQTRTVFAVGDAKQSIYSFQRADPAAFARMRHHFARRVTAAEQTWRPLELVRSYRSTPAVLEVVDQVFADAEARDGLFSERIAHDLERIGEGGLVELWPLERPEALEDTEPWRPPLEQRGGESPPARLAARIATEIGRWLERGEVLESKGRPVRPGDVMILVQRRRPFIEEMARALKLRDVPVTGLDRMVLTEQLAVMDLAALGRFVLLPEDDLTLAAVLKGPLVGLDEQALFELAYGRERSLWRALARRRGEVPAWRRAHAYLTDLLARADFTPPYEFYGRVLARLGGPHRLVARLGRAANDPIDEFLSLALAYESIHPPSLQGFLHWLEGGGVEITRDLEQGRDEVRVMTVHGSKGLQAPIVFLPDTCFVPSRGGQLLWLDGEGERAATRSVLWPARRSREESVCEAARAEEKRQRGQEYHRLLYVAMTRAEDRLYLCGWEGKRRRTEGCWYDLAGAALERIGEEVELGPGRLGRRYSTPQVAPPKAEAAALGAAAGAAPLPRWATRPPPAEATPPRPLAPSRPEVGEPAVRSPLAAQGDPGFRRGRLVHRLLELLPALERGRRAAAARRFLANPGHGLTRPEQAEIAAQTLAVLQDEAFAALFGPASRAEVALAGVVGARVISGQIDRLVVGEKEILIVDYKSNRSPPERADEVPEAYVRQLAAYRAVLRGIYPDRPVRCAILWTEGPSLMALPEPLLEAAAP